MDKCNSCGEERDIRWNVCPYCSNSYSDANIDEKSVLSVSNLVTDTAIGRDLHQKITINESSSRSTGCPQCGSQNVPVMVCLSNECNTTFCEFCYKSPWVNLVDADDRSLSTKEFKLVKERTDYGPYCGFHGKQLIHSRIEERKIISGEILREIDNEITQLNSNANTYNDPVRTAEGNITYWSTILNSAQSQFQTLSQLKKRFDDSESKIRKITKEKFDFEESLRFSNSANFFYLLGWILIIGQYFLLPISYKISEPLTMVAFFTSLIIVGCIIGVVTHDEPVGTKYGYTFFAPATITLNNIFICLIWFFSDIPSSVSTFEEIFLFVYVFSSFIIHYRQVELGFINNSMFTFELLSALSENVDTHRLPYSSSYDSEIEFEQQMSSGYLHDFTTLEIKGIPDTELDPTDRIASLKSIVEKYKVNLDSWQYNLDQLTKQIEHYMSEIRLLEAEKRLFNKQMFG